MRSVAVVAVIIALGYPTFGFSQPSEPEQPADPGTPAEPNTPTEPGPAGAESASPTGEAAAAGEDKQPSRAQTIEPEFEELDGPVAPARGIPLPKFETEFGAELRARALRIVPLELSGTDINQIHWTEQRARFDAVMRMPGIGALTFEMDALDGVMFGDNGQYIGDEPTSNSGVSLSSKRPNLAKWDIGLRGDDPLSRDDYGPVLVPAEPFRINHLYADVNLPFGLLRFGRQPLNYGATITSHDGKRSNRWGVSNYTDTVDRVMFATKVDEAVKAITGSDVPPDKTQDNGVFLALFHDLMKQNDPARFNDDLRQYGVALQWRAKDRNWFGADWSDFLLSQGAVRLRNKRFDSTAYGFPFVFQSKVGIFNFDAQYMFIFGETREISEGFAALARKKGVSQDIIGQGARAVVDAELGPVTLTLEGDYASGDDDPRPTGPITSFSFARDLNVGLLMFEHIVAFESARSAAVGIENLSGAEVTSFPLTEASTEGRFTNAIAVFPQVRVDWMEEKSDHQLHTRLGTLFAWSAAKGGVVDPIMTALGEDGEEITDDAVNYHGGDPQRWYGTEIDVQLGYSYKKHFHWVVEGAVLLPGPALWDENDDAVNSFLLENRFVLAF